MNLSTVFLSTFVLVFIGELGDKTQVAAGTSALANRKNTRTIFVSSILALISVSGLTVFGAGLIPETIVPTLRMVGGGLLVAYGMYLFGKAGTATDEDGETIEKSGWTLFVSQFFIVFMAELGDKTQIATLAAAIENQAGLLVVFAASSTALVTVTSITVWGITKVPRRGVEKLQRAGAVLMVIYGIYMLI